MMQEEQQLWVHIGNDGGIRAIWTEEPSLKEMQEAVDGYIEYAVLDQEKGGILPVPINKWGKPARSGQTSLCEVKDVVVNEEGLLRNDFTSNSVAVFAAYGLTVPEQEMPGAPMLVGPAVVHVVHKSTDKQISADEFMQLIGGKNVREGFWLFGIGHFHDAERGIQFPTEGGE